MVKTNFLKFSLIVALILFMSIFPSKSFIRSKSAIDDTPIINALAETVKNWYYKQRSKDFKNVVVNVVLVNDLPHFVENGRAEAVFSINAKMMPTATIEEIEKSPFLLGMQNYMIKNKVALSDSIVRLIEQHIEEWKNELIEAIGKPTEENVVLKIVCEVTPEGNIKSETAKIFYDISGHGSPYFQNANDLFVSTQLSREEEERMGYEEIKNLVEKINQDSNPSKGVSPTAYYDWYNRDNAKNYADNHTSNYPSDPQRDIINWTIKCWVWDETRKKYVSDDANGAMKDRTGHNIWNMSQYDIPIVTANGETRYSGLGCNNCCDFVSQAMYAGGMWADNYWNPSYRLTGAPNGKWYWTCVPHLVEYMTKTRHDWTKSDYNHTQNGDVVVWPDESHITMIDYNLYQNGSYTKKYAAHTTDARQHYYSSATGYTHYKVSCIRITPSY